MTRRPPSLLEVVGFVLVIGMVGLVMFAMVQP